jgi:hypothetical protein
MEVAGISPETMGVLAGVLTALFLANIGAILGGYISLIVRITKLEGKADTQSRDLNNLGSMFRGMIAPKNNRRK